MTLPSFYQFLILTLLHLLRSQVYSAIVTMQSTVPIYTAVDGCAHSFLSLADQMRKPTRFAEQVTVEAILDEFDRFKLW